MSDQVPAQQSRTCPYCTVRLRMTVPILTGSPVEYPVTTQLECVECGYQESGPELEREDLRRLIHRAFEARRASCHAVGQFGASDESRE